MFIDPLFDPKAIELEVNAVNSEYETSFSYPSMNLQNLLILLSDPAHPASRFSMGNNDSL
jgi:insulysin